MKMRKQTDQFRGYRFLMPNGQDAEVGDEVDVEPCCAAALSKRGWVHSRHWVDPNAPKVSTVQPVSTITAYDLDKPKTRRGRTSRDKES